jgi:hypothetical protein
MLQIRHVQRWATRHKVTIIGHETHRNKSDPKMGVQTIGQIWKHGQVRLPGKGMGRVVSLKLVDEVTRYPGGTYDDQVLAQWFGEWNLPTLLRPDLSKMHKLRRPSWMGGKDREPVPA